MPFAVSRDGLEFENQPHDGSRLMPKSPAQRFWLVKTEPDCFSINHLAKSPKQTTCWSGVRNYQARNFMSDMRLGDQVLFYHSSCDPPSVVGVTVVAKVAYPDATAWDKTDDHFDAKASPDNPIWKMVDLKLEEIFPRAIPIDELRGINTLKDMVLLKRGSRLSVQPVTSDEFKTILRLAHQPAAKQRS
jgi:predicted RNA-binding protein with PUA-like domain